MKKLVVIDGNSLANRAFYGVPILSNSQGVITNAVYGFTNMLTNLLAQEQPDYIAVAFDISRKVFRHEQYADYKAQRKGMPEELRGQMDLIKAVLTNMNIAIYQLEGFEGDDVIGTMVKWAETQDIASVIVTGDKDTFQLISEKTRVFLTKKGISEIGIYDLATLHDEYQLLPDQIRDLKGLMGDASDNIPGVPGVGEKTALKLLHQYGTVEAIYQHPEDFAGKKLGEKLLSNHEQAIMSKELATIFCQVPLEFDLALMVRHTPNVEGLSALYQELELSTLLKNLLANHQEAVSVIDDAGVEVGSPQQLQTILTQVAIKELPILLTVENKRIYESKVLEIGLLIDQTPYVIYCHDDFSLYAQLLKPYLVDGEVLKMTDDAKKLYTYFLREDIAIEGLDWDSLLGSYLLNPENKDLSLDKLLYDNLGLSLNKEAPFYTFGKLQGMVLLHQTLVEQLEHSALSALYGQIELPLSRILAKMELQGVKLDEAYLQTLGQELGARIEMISQTIYALAGENFNLNSPKQLAVVLFEKLGLPAIKKTKTGYSTDAEVLETLAEEHAIVKDILDYRQLNKIKSTYIDGLLNIVNPVTGKVHTSFNQTITATGRLSSTEPNLQNIPIKTEEGKRIRKAFIPSEAGQLLLAADYSQIELRILAHMSQDDVLLDSFHHNQDIHTRTASEVFNVPMAEVTPAMRRNAKAVNFGIIYGQSDYGLSKELGITRKEAKAYIEGYFAKYSGVRRWIEETIAHVREDGYITTMLGRRRYINDINSKNFNLRSFAERTAVNTPIQGSAADIIKIAMINVQEQLVQRQFKAKMILQVHDELIFEVAPLEVARLIVLVKDCMEKAVPLDVPLNVDINAGFNWFDMETI